MNRFIFHSVYGRIIASALILLICLSAVCAVCFADSPAGPEVSADKVITVRTADELKLIAQYPDKDFILAADIDLDGVEWTPCQFSGTLDGGGHTIYNLHIDNTGLEVCQTVDGNDKRYDTVFAGLFSVLNKASVHDLNIKGAYIEISSSENCFAAVLAGYFENSEIVNCGIEGRVRLYSQGSMVGVGGIVGSGCGLIDSCSANVELLFADRSEGIKCEQFMGGIMACGYADITNCSVNIMGFDSCHGYVHNGGLVGMYSLLKYTYIREASSLFGNTVNGKITFFEDNSDRRAYCERECGEMILDTRYIKRTDNTGDFIRDETFDYSEELTPDEWSFSDTSVSGSCTEWGYTKHECASIGYIWCDHYTSPVHIAGEWEDADIPESDKTLLDCVNTAPELKYHIKKCTLCGTELDAELYSPAVEAECISVYPTELRLHIGDCELLTPSLLPADVTDPTVIYSSADESIVTVDKAGNVTAVGEGITQVYCTCGEVSTASTVYVSYTFPQFILHFVLFGWLFGK